MGEIPPCHVGVVWKWGRDPARIFKVGTNLVFQLCNLGPLNIYTVEIHTKKINTGSNKKDQAGKEVKSKREHTIKLDFLSIFILSSPSANVLFQPQYLWQYQLLWSQRLICSLSQQVCNSLNKLRKVQSPTERDKIYFKKTWSQAGMCSLMTFLEAVSLLPPPLLLPIYFPSVSWLKLNCKIFWIASASFLCNGPWASLEPPGPTWD